MKRTTKQLFMSMTLTLAMFAAGQSQVAEAATGDLVNPNQVYSYEQMTTDIQELKNAYPQLIEYKSIGKTPYGRDIWAVKLGRGPATIFINGSHHAREWLTTNLNMYMIDQYAKAYAQGGLYAGYSVRSVLDHTSIWFVPMVNPDGVTLVQRGSTAFPENVRNGLIQMNDGSRNFSRWKANGVGIDLNRQYPANWQSVSSPKSPYYQNYKGSAPVQASESKAIVNFTYETQPEIASSYHSAGRVIYWYYYNKPENLERDRRIANRFAELTGYKLMSPGSSGGGGYTDWFIQEFGRPGFTPELGVYPGDIPLPISAFPDEWRRNQTIGLYLASEGYKLWYPKHTADVKIDGVMQAYNPKAVIINNRTLVPMRGLFESLGATVSWDAATSTVTATKDEHSVTLTIGSQDANQDGNPIELDVAPLLLQDRTMIPLRFAAESLGVEVSWDAPTKTVNVTRPPL